jgi:trafficking protein particle complex subunit 8
VTSQQSLTEFDPWLQYCKFNDLFNNQNQNDSFDQSFDDSTPDISLNESVISNPLISNSKNLKNNGDLPNLAAAAAQPTQVKRHGICLALSDHDRIKTLISEFLQRGLVPYVERTIKILNEQIQSKKSILKSFGIPRRIFGGGSSSPSSVIKPSSSSVSISASGLSSSNNGNNQSVVSNTSGITITNSTTFAGSNDELHVRRLADLAFMFRLYDLAFNSYHSCKKEFTSFINNSSNQSNTEQLLNMTLYLAGALEMATISNFMQNFGSDLNYSSMSQSSSVSSLSSIQSSPTNVSTSSSSSSGNKTYNFTYIEEAIQLLVNTCKNNYFATRCTLLSTEALKTNNQFYKAAYQFINLSSDESEIRSALFLEQAAQCYLAIQYPQPSIRKYAFFMSIAGYRFGKAGQVNINYYND